MSKFSNFTKFKTLKLLLKLLVTLKKKNKFTQVSLLTLMVSLIIKVVCGRGQGVGGIYASIRAYTTNFTLNFKSCFNPQACVCAREGL